MKVSGINLITKPQCPLRKTLVAAAEAGPLFASLALALTLGQFNLHGVQ